MSEIIPVFLGADLNCYNFARAFHEAYGVESYAYGRYPMAPTKYSKIVHFTTVPDMDNEDTMLRILHEFAAQHPADVLHQGQGGGVLGHDGGMVAQAVGGVLLDHRVA